MAKTFEWKKTPNVERITMWHWETEITDEQNPEEKKIEIFPFNAFHKLQIPRVWEQIYLLRATTLWEDEDNMKKILNEFAAARSSNRLFWCSDLTTFIKEKHFTGLFLHYIFKIYHLIIIYK